LPKPHAVRPTPEDFKKLLELKGVTPEEIEAERQAQIVEQTLCPEDMFKELLPAMCRISNRVGACCYYYSTGTEYLACWGELWIATLEDPEVNNYYACTYPIYPLRVDSLSFQTYNWYDPVTLKVRAEIWSIDYSSGYAYPGTMLYSNPTTYTWVQDGGFERFYIPFTNACVNGPFFAMWIIENTDDFEYDPADTIPPIYCDSVPYNFHISWLFDQSARKGVSYWGPYGEYGLPYGFLDVVENGIESGAISRLEAYTTPAADGNGCPTPPETWYFKDPYPPGAPCGVPDFDQNQMPGPAYCAPTSSANSIWWFAARGDFPPSWGGFTPADPPTLIGELATLMETDPQQGTDLNKIGPAILQTIFNHGGWWFTLNEVSNPDFWYIQKELRDCEDVILLLGFWQEDPPGTWHRFGGHFVTLSGVDIFNYAFAFSDPAKDNFEFGGGPGQICGTHNPANDPIDHNSGITSYDYYMVAWPSASPGGLLYLPDYVANWPTFQDQNFRPQHQPNHGTFNPSLPVHVEIEQVIVVSPGLSRMTGEVKSSKAYEIENNQGGIEGFGVDFVAGLVEGTYAKGASYVLGTSQADLSCDFQDYNPLSSFLALDPPVCDSFWVSGAAGNYKIEQCNYSFANKFLTDLEVTKYAFGFWVPVGGTEDCEYVTEDVYVVTNVGTDTITGIQSGVILDYDVGTATANTADFDTQHQSIWMWDPTKPDNVFGLTKKPAVVGNEAITGWALMNPGRVWVSQLDSLKSWMESLGWGVDPGPTDYTMMVADKPFDLAAGAMHIEKWIKWGHKAAIGPGGDAAWRCFLYDILHQEGYFRGDVNGDKKLSLGDIVYLINYSFKMGPQPYEFTDQGDVNNDNNVNLADIVYLINYLFKQGPAPIDKNRFLLESPYVDPTHQALGIRDPGLFGEPAWMKLGR